MLHRRAPNGVRQASERSEASCRPVRAPANFRANEDRRACSFCRVQPKVKRSERISEAKCGDGASPPDSPESAQVPQPARSAAQRSCGRICGAYPPLWHLRRLGGVVALCRPPHTSFRLTFALLCSRWHETSARNNFPRAVSLAAHALSLSLSLPLPSPPSPSFLPYPLAAHTSLTFSSFLQPSFSSLPLARGGERAARLK